LSLNQSAKRTGFFRSRQLRSKRCFGELFDARANGGGFTHGGVCAVRRNRLDWERFDESGVGCVSTKRRFDGFCGFAHGGVCALSLVRVGDRDRARFGFFGFAHGDVCARSLVRASAGGEQDRNLSGDGRRDRSRNRDICGGGGAGVGAGG